MQDNEPNTPLIIGTAVLITVLASIATYAAASCFLNRFPIECVGLTLSWIGFTVVNVVTCKKLAYTWPQTWRLWPAAFTAGPSIVVVVGLAQFSLFEIGYILLAVIFVASTAGAGTVGALTGCAKKRDDVESGNLCSSCGYDLRMNESGVCPECGWNRAEEKNAT